MTRPGPARRLNRHLWLLDPLRELPGCEVRALFGTRACYFNGLLVLAVSDRDEPWRGVLVPCEREQHATILRDFPALAPHPILPKWLYLPESAASFERDAEQIVACIRRHDERFGIVPLGRSNTRGRRAGRSRRR